MDFTVTLSDDDWDAVKGGWRCSALQIPGTRVKNVYVDGYAVDAKLYSVNDELFLIRWGSNTHPKQASVHVQALKPLSTEELTLKWKKIAIILPVVGALATGLITSRLSNAPQPSLAAGGASNYGILKIFEQSNDFLSTGPNQFASILKKAKREAWFVGTTFYISVDQFHDLILNRLADGVDLNFLILNPDSAGAETVANLLGVTENELVPQCIAGIRTLNRIVEEARKANYPGTLRTELISEQFQSRLYFFDPKSNEGVTYYVPQINGTNSQFLPGFLVDNATAKFPSTYFNGVLKLWNSSNAQTLGNWNLAHPDLK